jgi:hypothetical protein
VASQVQLSLTNRSLALERNNVPNEESECAKRIFIKSMKRRKVCELLKIVGVEVLNADIPPRRNADVSDDSDGSDESDMACALSPSFATGSDNGNDVSMNGADKVIRINLRVEQKRKGLVCLLTGLRDGKVTIASLDDIAHKGPCWSCKEQLECSWQSALGQQKFPFAPLADDAAVQCTRCGSGNYIAGFCVNELVFSSSVCTNHCRESSCNDDFMCNGLCRQVCQQCAPYFGSDLGYPHSIDRSPHRVSAVGCRCRGSGCVLKSEDMALPPHNHWCGFVPGLKEVV